MFHLTEGKHHMNRTPAGSQLDAILDDMDVEGLWQSGQYVYWQTGITMPVPPPASEGYETETHCSAFAAAAALKLGVPLLHPNPAPKFVPEKHLANAQAKWLETLPQGWQSVSGPVEAQNLANQAYFVLISYFNPNVSSSGVPESGHIQVVRAYPGRTDAELKSEGPQITQAGVVNYKSATAAHGFGSGYSATYSPYPWPDNVQYYAHAAILPESGG
jgi:hypothetical protein